MQVIDLSSLPMREKDKICLKNYLIEMNREMSDKILSIVLYGSVAKDNFFPGASDINLMIVVPVMKADILKTASPIIKRYNAGCRITTFLVDVNDIKDSSDVFPIIYLDIKKHHVLLQGEDIFAKMEICPHNLRYDLERQMREVLLHLRRDYVHSNYTAAELRNIIVSNFSNFSRLLSALLHLKGNEPPVKKEEIIEKSSQILNIDAAPLKKIISLKTGGNNPLKAEMQELFENYLEIVEKVVEIVDKIQT